MKICSVTEMRALDRRAMEEYGIPEELLMENAGEALYFVIMKCLGIAGKRFVVFSGPGNNGGDGFVTARKIHSNGGTVRVFILGDPDKYEGAAKLNFEIVSRLRIEINRIESAQAVKNAAFHCDGIVDAIFGTGLMREVGGVYGDVIALINEAHAAGKMVFSADIPSGVQGDTGKVMGVSVKADHTVTFGLPKIGNLLYPGYALCGRLYVTHISFPPAMIESHGIRTEVNQPSALPGRSREGHKGAFGKVLFIAGAPAYFGAPYFAALSFMKGGGGYGRLAAPKSLIPFIAEGAREIVFVPQQETAAGTISLANKELLMALSEEMDMVVVGPGLSLNEETQQLVRELVRNIKKPLLIDGDGITALHGDLGLLASRRGDTVLTPHMGEMSRLSGFSIEHIASDRIGVLRRLAQDADAMVVLKGAHTLVALADEKVFLNMTGNSGMATAGSGDVLVGTISAMFGLGLPLAEAVKKGVFIHGLAGDLAAQEKGEDGITAQDILQNLPLAVKTDREGLDANLRARSWGPEVV